MRIIIPSFNRPDTISTHLLLEGLDYYIFLHDEEQLEAYKKNPTIDLNRVVVTNAPRGVAHQRQWIQDNFLEENEWFISMDDNIVSFEAVSEPYYSEEVLDVQKDPAKYKAIFENKVSTERFMDICEEMREHGQKVGAYNLGFSTTPNFFFRARKYRYVGYVISKAVVRKNLKIPFEIENASMEDFAYTAECLLRHGKVLINNFAFPVAKHYMKGGIGTYVERLPAKIRDSAFLMQKYPGLFRYKVKAGCDPKAELAIRFTDLKQLEKWRAFMRVFRR